MISTLLASACLWMSAPRTLYQAPDKLYEVRTTSNIQALVSRESATPEPIYASYVSWVRSHVDPDPRALLERQRERYARMKLERELRVFDLILSGSAGHLRPASCLETLLLSEQLSLQTGVDAETEFAAFILIKESPSGPLLRVYSILGTAMSPPPFERVIPDIKADRDHGWRVHAVVHNHFFIFTPDAYDIAGTTIPSAQDADTFAELGRELGLEQAWITNGISTITIRADEFSRFQRE